MDEDVRSVRADFGGRVVTWFKAHGIVLMWGAIVVAVAAAFFANVQAGRAHKPLPKTVTERVEVPVVRTVHVEVPVDREVKVVEYRNAPPPAVDESAPASKKGNRVRRPPAPVRTTQVQQQQSRDMPVEFTCEQVREAVKTYGVLEMMRLAKQYGVSQAQIRQAKRCMGWRK